MYLSRLQRKFIRIVSCIAEGDLRSPNLLPCLYIFELKMKWREINSGGKPTRGDLDSLLRATDPPAGSLVGGGWCEGAEEVAELAGLTVTKLSGNIPFFPFSSPSHHPSSTWRHGRSDRERFPHFTHKDIPPSHSV